MPCIFCNNSKTSKEHLWGAWWQEYYPPNNKSMLLRDLHTITKRGSKNEPIAVKGQFSNVGNPLSATTKVVCENCNNTWMSIIEEDMKNSFNQVFLKKEESISEEVKSHIKNWIYMKFCLLDRAYSDNSYAIPNDPKKSNELKVKVDLKRSQRWCEFHTEKVIPDEYQFYISRSADINKKIGSFNHIPKHIVELGDELNIKLQDTCLFFNGDFIAVLTNDNDIRTLLHEESVSKNSNLYNLLNSSTQKFTNNYKVNGNILEDSILRELEKNIGFKLRRNYT